MTDKRNPNTPTLRLGTRGSPLARWQAEWVAAQLRRVGHAVEIVEITTRGDVERTVSVEEIGTRGVFTKEIQRAILSGEVDVGVHSLKDLPTEPVDGLVLSAVPPRKSAHDVLVASGAFTLHSLPRGARIGTGSLRRQAQLRHFRSDFRPEDVRGNVDTRLQKLEDGHYDALILAEAGLRRLGRHQRITQVLPFDIMLPAVGQGALAIECRADDAATQAALGVLEDRGTRAAITAERALLEHLRGGCMAPVGGLGQMEAGQLHLSAVVLSPDGTHRLAARETGLPADAAGLGRRVGEVLLAQGAADLIAASRSGPA